MFNLKKLRSYVHSHALNGRGKLPPEQSITRSVIGDNLEEITVTLTIRQVAVVNWEEALGSDSSRLVKLAVRVKGIRGSALNETVNIHGSTWTVKPRGSWLTVTQLRAQGVVYSESEETVNA